MIPSRICLMACVTCLFSAPSLSAEDVVEFLSGAKMTGTVTEIRKDAKEFDFEATIGARTVASTYPFAKVHAVTYQGSRFVLTPKTSDVETTVDPSGTIKRSTSEINQIIEEVGSTMPDWFESTQLDYPPTLDLAWPIKPEGSWNNRKNMGQFIWDVINPNPFAVAKRNQTGTSLHDAARGPSCSSQAGPTDAGTHVLSICSRTIPRAAYWLRQGGVEKGQGTAVMLAECYWRLGNRQMATPYLVSRTYNAGAAASAIKLYGNMGMLTEAMKMTQRIADSAASYEGFIAAGDAMRQAGRFDQAIEFYNRVLS